MRWKLWVTVTGPGGTMEVEASPHTFNADSINDAVKIVGSAPLPEGLVKIVGIRLEEETVNPLPLRWRDHEGFKFSKRLDDAVGDFFNGGYLLVVPGGFLVVDGDDLVVQAGLRTKEQMEALNESNQWSEVSQCLKCDEFCVSDYCEGHGR